ncbi:hypothetical protein [Neptuniibacter sp. QD37_11]|uniref:hypothetical protein n=1 Tax=Neptuniibacter sp. QD37_11 TaxID=3398209 RepID=UPI0039F51E58
MQYRSVENEDMLELAFYTEILPHISSLTPESNDSLNALEPFVSQNSEDDAFSLFKSICNKQGYSIISTPNGFALSAQSMAEAYLRNLSSLNFDDVVTRACDEDTISIDLENDRIIFDDGSFLFPIHGKAAPNENFIPVNSESLTELASKFNRSMKSELIKEDDGLELH